MAEEAHKEPTMEEILASIRKIISEDEDTRPASADQAQLRTVDADTELGSVAEDPAIDDDDSMFEEFDLSDLSEETVEEAVTEAVEEFTAPVFEEPAAAELDVFEDMSMPEEESESSFEEDAFDMPETVSDFVSEAAVAFRPEPEPEPEPEVEFNLDPEPEVEPVSVTPAPVPTPEPKSESPEEVKMQAALTESSTEAAAAGALARLVSKMDMGSENTLEGLVRELLKPMIKEWLDANLPAIVEDKVEAEVQRIARLAR